MTFLIQQTMLFAVPLMIVALAGVFSERSGIINLALEGIMIFGAFIGVLAVRLLQSSEAVLAAKAAKKEGESCPCSCEEQPAGEETQQKVCPVCGESSDGKFCPKCGAPMGE